MPSSRPQLSIELLPLTLPTTLLQPSFCCCAIADCCRHSMDIIDSCLALERHIFSPAEDAGTGHGHSSRPSGDSPCLGYGYWPKLRICPGPKPRPWPSVQAQALALVQSLGLGTGPGLGPCHPARLVGTAHGVEFIRCCSVVWYRKKSAARLGRWRKRCAIMFEFVP